MPGKWLLDISAGCGDAKRAIYSFTELSIYGLGGVLPVAKKNGGRYSAFRICFQYSYARMGMMNVLNCSISKIHDAQSKNSSSEIYGYTTHYTFAHKIPICGMAGDQQAALLAKMCIEPGSVKNTFTEQVKLLMNSGEKPIMSEKSAYYEMAKLHGKLATR